VKNVARQSSANQLRDFAAYANQEGPAFDLIVRHSTTLSKPLEAARDAGLINVIRMLP